MTKKKQIAMRIAALRGVPDAQQDAASDRLLVYSEEDLLAVLAKAEEAAGVVARPPRRSRKTKRSAKKRASRRSARTASRRRSSRRAAKPAAPARRRASRKSRASRRSSRRGVTAVYASIRGKKFPYYLVRGYRVTGYPVGGGRRGPGAIRPLPGSGAPSFMSLSEADKHAVVAFLNGAGRELRSRGAPKGVAVSAVVAAHGLMQQRASRASRKAQQRASRRMLREAHAGSASTTSRTRWW